MKLRYLLPAVLLGALSTASMTAQAAVTVLGWPGGPEETALRAAVKAYNALPDVAADNKVELLFFSRDGFYDKLAADLAANTDAFDVT